MASDSDYAYLRALVRTESANLIDASRNALFDTRLTSIARLAGASSLEGLVDLLRVDRTMRLHRAVAEAMTINETSFFRDGSPFEVLRLKILPAILKAKRQRGEKTLRVWSAAASTGQEAYSVAMLLSESFPELVGWTVQVLGTDLSRTVVEYAAAGRFRRLEVNRGLPETMLLKYFVRDGDEWEAGARLRGMCTFQQANLCGPLPALPVFDLVLLRNVLLYFAQEDRGAVFERVRRQMTPEGYLLLGNAEQAEDSTDLFQVEFATGCYFYRPVG